MRKLAKRGLSESRKLVFSGFACGHLAAVRHIMAPETDLSKLHKCVGLQRARELGLRAEVRGKKESVRNGQTIPSPPVRPFAHTRSGGYTAVIWPTSPRSCPRSRPATRTPQSSSCR